MGVAPAHPQGGSTRIMQNALSVAEAVLFGVLTLVSAPLWLPALVFVLWRDGTGFSRQSECEYLRRLRAGAAQRG